MKKLTILLIVILLSSCATERFGRQQSLTQIEKKELTCREILIEEAKAKEFLEKLYNEVIKFKATDVLAFLGDLGIGNVIEVYHAEKSGEKRLKEITELKKAKGC